MEVERGKEGKWRGGIERERERERERGRECRERKRERGREEKIGRDKER